MSDAEQTVTNWKTKLLTAWGYAKTHWVWVGPLAGFAAGWLFKAL